GFKANDRASASSAGLGTDSSADTDDGEGINIGFGNSALVQSEIGGGANIRGTTVQMSAGVGVQHGVNPVNDSVTSPALIAQAVIHSDSDATAVGADSDATANISVGGDLAQVQLDNNASITGDSVTLYATHLNIDFQANANANTTGAF